MADVFDLSDEQAEALAAEAWSGTWAPPEHDGLVEDVRRRLPDSAARVV